MSQQHSQFEEEFRDGPPPTSAYQGGYTGPQPVSYTVNVPPPVQSYMTMPGQKLLMQDMQSGRSPGPGQRLALAIISAVFTFFTFMITLIVVGTNNQNPFPIDQVTIFFALIFAVFMLILNLVFNRRH